MKPLKIAGLFALLILCGSCVDILAYIFGYNDSDPESVIYNLGLNFQDASGNDLVKGIGLGWMDSTYSEAKAQAGFGLIDSTIFTLDIIVSEPCSNWDNTIYNTPARPGYEPAVNRPSLTMCRYNGYWYLTNWFSLPVNDCPEEKILTYKLKCPSVFGDEAIHEFVTYWDIPKAINKMHYAKCLRIEFDGNEITPQLFTDIYKNGIYVAIIKLNS